MPVASFLLLVVYIAVLVTLTPAFTTTTFPPPPAVVSQIGAPIQSGDVKRVHTALVVYTTRTGATPTNALELLRNNDLTVNGFIASNSMTLERESIPFGLRLDHFGTATDAELAALLDQAGDAVPIDMIAHRVGDYVFTYHGVDLASPQDGRLWVVIRSLDPTVQQLGIENAHSIVTAGGAVVNITDGVFDTMLSGQNALREEFGLPPLPHPDRVRADSPIIAPD